MNDTAIVGIAGGARTITATRSVCGYFLSRSLLVMMPMIGIVPDDLWLL